MRLILALVLGVALLTGCTQPATITDAPVSGDQTAESAYQEQRSHIQITGTGVVTRILADDTNGDRHQRFILTLDSGQTLLVAHNIDMSSRV